jgi:hypothetical protein
MLRTVSCAACSLGKYWKTLLQTFAKFIDSKYDFMPKRKILMVCHVKIVCNHEKQVRQRPRSCPGECMGPPWHLATSQPSFDVQIKDN